MMQIAMILAQQNMPWVVAPIQFAAEYSGCGVETDLLFVKSVMDAVNFTRASQGKTSYLPIHHMMYADQEQNRLEVLTAVRLMIDDVAVDGENFTVESKPSSRKGFFIVTVKLNW